MGRGQGDSQAQTTLLYGPRGFERQRSSEKQSTAELLAATPLPEDERYLEQIPAAGPFQSKTNSSTCSDDDSATFIPILELPVLVSTATVANTPLRAGAEMYYYLCLAPAPTKRPDLEPRFVAYSRIINPDERLDDAHLHLGSADLDETLEALQNAFEHTRQNDLWKGDAAEISRRSFHQAWSEKRASGQLR